MQSSEVESTIAHFSHTYSRIIFKTLKRVYSVQMNASLSAIFNHLGLYLKLSKDGELRFLILDALNYISRPCNWEIIYHNIWELFRQTLCRGFCNRDIKDLQIELKTRCSSLCSFKIVRSNCVWKENNIVHYT